MEKWGLGLCRKEVLNIVGEFVKRNNLKTPFKNGIPGEDWLYLSKTDIDYQSKNPNL